MPRFRVTFRKIVYDNTGHARTICQRIVEVEARGSGSAQATAIGHFCQMENIANWLEHADWMETARLDPMPVRPPVDCDPAERRAA